MTFTGATLLSPHLKAVKDRISKRSLDQQLVGSLKRWPVLHFTDHAEAILREGFRFGEANPDRLDLTTELDGTPKPHPGPGYNFAFNALSWDIENDMHDFQVIAPESERGLNMGGTSAILFLGDGLHTRHYDEFHQVIFCGAEADLTHALHIRNLGERVIESEVFDDEIDCWEIFGANGDPIPHLKRHLTLAECVVTGLHYYHTKNLLGRKAMHEMVELYAGEMMGLGLEIKLPKPPDISAIEL
jgi:hypothetical protein